jgi:hypothetical protein
MSIISPRFSELRDICLQTILQRHGGGDAGHGGRQSIISCIIQSSIPAIPEVVTVLETIPCEVRQRRQREVIQKCLHTCQVAQVEEPDEEFGNRGSVEAQSHGGKHCSNSVRNDNVDMNVVSKACRTVKVTTEGSTEHVEVHHGRRYFIGPENAQPYGPRVCPRAILCSAVKPIGCIGPCARKISQPKVICTLHSISLHLWQSPLLRSEVFQSLDNDLGSIRLLWIERTKTRIRNPDDVHSGADACSQAL